MVVRQAAFRLDDQMMAEGDFIILFFVGFILILRFTSWSVCMRVGKGLTDAHIA